MHLTPKSPCTFQIHPNGITNMDKTTINVPAPSIHRPAVPPKPVNGHRTGAPPLELVSKTNSAISAIIVLIQYAYNFASPRRWTAQVHFRILHARRRPLPPHTQFLINLCRAYHRIIDVVTSSTSQRINICVHFIVRRPCVWQCTCVCLHFACPICGECARSPATQCGLSSCVCNITNTSTHTGRHAIGHAFDEFGHAHRQHIT